ncbi:TAP42-like protein [Canariomyces notabilis]|uniref:TAP42-like protein n=1 Tax=Canariomyces notabilis TaxID=2074819 RepID=A0AAN6TDA8_9PEZI|nr:TAP42-like protein [Canariomyces arenarius]
MDRDDEPRSLKTVFADAESKRLALENSQFAPNSAEYSDVVSSAIKLYEECLRLIDAVSLFSPNESLEDLSTSDLPFLLTNFHLAELTQKTPFTSPQDRKRVLKSARNAYERYLHLVDSYGLLSAAHRKLLEQYNDSPISFSTVPANPAARRDAKIANFKLEKELRSRLEFLRRRPEYGAAEGEGSAAGDEDLVRETHLAHLNYSTHLTFQALEMLNREWEMLAHAPPPPPPSTAQLRGGRILPGEGEGEEADSRRRNGSSNDGYTDRLDHPSHIRRSGGGGPLLTAQGKPLQPFTLLNNRQELAKGVFRPGHNLPTMTIDEYLAEERRRGGIIEGGGEASLRRDEEPDEDDMDKADAETMKARAWDEFVEANPRGSGNTLNRG